MIFQIENIAFTDAGGLLWHLITRGIKNWLLQKFVKFHTNQTAVTKIYLNVFIKIILLEQSKKRRRRKNWTNGKINRHSYTYTNNEYIHVSTHTRTRIRTLIRTHTHPLINPKVMAIIRMMSIQVCAAIKASMHLMFTNIICQF